MTAARCFCKLLFMLSDPINISFDSAGEGYIKILSLSQITFEATVVQDFEILYARTLFSKVV